MSLDNKCLFKYTPIVKLIPVIKLKTYIRRLSIPLLHLVSLETNAVNYLFFDTNQFPSSFEIVLDKVNDYQGEMKYSIVLPDSNIWHSGNAHCDYSICTILDLPFESAIKPGTIITLSKNGVVRYAAPYGPEYLKKIKFLLTHLAWVNILFLN